MSDTPDSKVEWAVKLAHYGYAIFELREGSKVPLHGESWLAHMTTDEPTIRSWFSANPKMNYGVCGSQFGAIVDVDSGGKKGKHGDKEFAEIESKQNLDEWISTAGLSVRTPTGGVHYYVATPFPVSNAHRFPAGIDVRGTAGYVVGPHCELIEGLCKASDTPGVYTVQNNEAPVKAPTWIIERLKHKGERDANVANPVFELDSKIAIDRAIDYIRLRKPAIRGQEGDKHTLVTAMQVMDFGISEEKTLEILTDPLIKTEHGNVSWNDNCEPPWDYDALTMKIANAWRYREERPGVKGVGLLEAFDAEYGEALAQDGMESASDKWDRIRQHLFPGGKLFTRGKSKEMVIPEWLPGHGMTALLAIRSMGKSVTMIDMALRLSLDMDWHGMPVRKGYYAIYICGEDDEGAEEQIRAWCIAHDLEEPPARFIFLDIITDLLSTADVREWAECLKDFIGTDSRAVIFMDTWQRATSAGGQNKDEDMQRAVHHAEALGRSLNGPVVMAAHPSKDNENAVLGSSIIENSTTAIWTLKQHVLGKKLEVTRIKGRGHGNYQVFKFVEQSIGIADDFGRPRTGIYPVKIGGRESGDGEPRIDIESQRTAFANVIAQIDMDRLDPVYGGDSNDKPYSVSQVAQKISTFEEQARGIDADGVQTARAKWAAEMLGILKHEAGAVAFGEKTLRTWLTEMFKDVPQGHPMKDGMCIRMRMDGKAQRFYFEKNLMDREEPVI